MNSPKNEQMDKTIPANKAINAPLNPPNDRRGVSET